MERRRWSTRHNPSLRSRWVKRFLAWRGRRVVGRIAVVEDPSFSARWEAGAGFFGFFECEDDSEAAAALFQAAEEVLRARGLKQILGPVNLTTHDEVGLLVEGFDSPPTLLSPFNPRYYSALVERNGYLGHRDYHAYTWRPEAPQSSAVNRLASAAEKQRGRFEGLVIRSADPARWEQETALMHALYNTSFADLWGFVPISAAEFADRAESFRPFYRPEAVVIAEVDGHAVGFGLVLPDLNEVLAKMHGRLLPFGWLRLQRGIPRIRTGRFILMGVSPEQAGRGIAPLIAVQMRRAVLALGLSPLEISLVAGMNRRMQHVVEAFGCIRSKTYRLYRKPL